MTMRPAPISHDEAIDLAPSFVLGALEPAEMAAVREHLATCAQSHAEFEELGGVVPYLLDSPGIELVEPPAALGDRIMAAAAADLAERRGASTVEHTATAMERTAASERSAPVPFPSAEERAARAERTQRSRLAWIAGVAAVLAIIALGAWNLRLQGQVNDLEQQVGAAGEFQQAVATVLDVAATPGAQTAILAPVEAGGPRGIAAVAADGSIQFALQDLVPTSGDEVYETWAIVGDAAPVPLGSFTVDESGTASFTSRQGPSDPGIVVAVSREPAAGATAPTAVVSAGQATPPPA